MPTHKLSCGCEFEDKKPDESYQEYTCRLINHVMDCDKAKQVLWESRRRSESKDEQKPV